MTSKGKRVSYDCRKCPAYCCAIYDLVHVNKRDLERLARHFGVTSRVAAERYTKLDGKDRVLRRRIDPIFGRACRFLDVETRGCTIYQARPKACRDYPGQSSCTYYNVLQFERDIQNDPDVIPVVQIITRTRQKRDKG